MKEMMAELKRLSTGFQGIVKPAWRIRCDKCKEAYGEFYFNRELANNALDDIDQVAICPDCKNE